MFTASRTVNGNAACRRPYLRERIPQDPPGEMPGQGGPYGDLSGDTRNGLTTPLEPPGLQHPATPPLLKSVDEAQPGGPNGISPGLDLHVCYSLDRIASSVDTFRPKSRLSKSAHAGDFDVDGRWPSHSSKAATAFRFSIPVLPS
jgi:hypothetical protein